MTTVIDQGLMSSTIQDQRYVGLCDAEPLAYFGLGHGSSKSSYFLDFNRRQEFLEESDSSDIDSVLLVKMVGTPFEIGYDVIRFETVNMVDDRKVIGIGDERETDKSVNMDGLAFPISEKIDVSIAQFIGAGPQDFPIYPSRFQTIADAIKAAHATEVTDLVEISEVFDRNRSPFFCEDDIHSTGCPSGEVGLAVKSPSYALTCGGLAFMAPVSTFFNTLQ